MFDIDNATVEELRPIAKAALALSTKMVETEKPVCNAWGIRSSFEVEEEWSNLTATFMAIDR